jgi:hypothetical protein
VSDPWGQKRARGLSTYKLHLGSTDEPKFFLRACPIPAKVNLSLTTSRGGTTGRGRV